MADDAIVGGEAENVRERLWSVEEGARNAQSEIGKHDAVCAERYAGVQTKFSAFDRKLNWVLLLVGLAVTAEVFGGKEAIHAALKVLGVTL